MVAGAVPSGDELTEGGGLGGGPDEDGAAEIEGRPQGVEKSGVGILRRGVEVFRVGTGGAGGGNRVEAPLKGDPAPWSGGGHMGDGGLIELEVDELEGIRGGFEGVVQRGVDPFFVSPGVFDLDGLALAVRFVGARPFVVADIVEAGAAFGDHPVEDAVAPAVEEVPFVQVEDMGVGVGEGTPALPETVGVGAVRHAVFAFGAGGGQAGLGVRGVGVDEGRKLSLRGGDFGGEGPYLLADLLEGEEGGQLHALRFAAVKGNGTPAPLALVGKLAGEAGGFGAGIAVGQHEPRGEGEVRMGVAGDEELEGDILEVGFPVGFDRAFVLGEKGIGGFAGLHLDEAALVALFFEDVDAREKPVVPHEGFEEDDVFFLQVAGGFGGGLFGVERVDGMPAGEGQAGDLADKVPVFGKVFHEGVVVLCIGIPALFIPELGGAFAPHFEIGLGQIDGRGHGVGEEN